MQIKRERSRLHRSAFPGVLACAAVYFAVVGAHAQTLNWVVGAGGTAADFGADIAVSGDGSVFVAGRFDGIAVFGEGQAGETTLSSTGLPDIFVAKYASDGTLVWVRQIESETESDRLPSIAVDAGGNCVVTSRFADSAVFGRGEPAETTLASAGGADIFLAKHDSLGTLVWAVRAGGAMNDQGNGVAVDAAGRVYLAGFFIGTATFGQGESNETLLTDAGSGDYFLAAFTPAGQLTWVKSGGGDRFDVGAAVAVDGSGAVWLAGTFQGDATFGAGDPNETLLTAGLVDLFVATFDTAGVLQWVTQSTGDAIEAATDLAVDGAGNAVITGYFEDSSTFGLGESNQTLLTSAGQQDILVAGYGQDGSLRWARRAGGSGPDWGAGIAIGGSGNSFATGSFEGTAVFGPGEGGQTVLNSDGGRNIFLGRFDAEGALGWAWRAGGAQADEGAAVVVASGSAGFVTGRFEDDATFGAGTNAATTLTSAGETDAFLARFDPDAATGVSEQTELPGALQLEGNYPNPFNPETRIRYSLPVPGRISIAVFTPGGRLVRTLFSGIATAGTREVAWQGRNDAGRSVGSGIYVVVLRSGTHSTTRKMLLLR